jgi:hypothetical protein
MWQHELHIDAATLPQRHRFVEFDVSGRAAQAAACGQPDARLHCAIKKSSTRAIQQSSFAAGAGGAKDKPTFKQDVDARSGRPCFINKLAVCIVVVSFRMDLPDNIMTVLTGPGFRSL